MAMASSERLGTSSHCTREGRRDVLWQLDRDLHGSPFILTPTLVWRGCVFWLRQLSPRLSLRRAKTAGREPDASRSARWSTVTDGGILGRSSEHGRDALTFGKASPFRPLGHLTAAYVPLTPTRSPACASSRMPLESPFPSGCAPSAALTSGTRESQTMGICSSGVAHSQGVSSVFPAVLVLYLTTRVLSVSGVFSD